MYYVTLYHQKALNAPTRPEHPCTPMYALYATVHHRTPLHALKGQKLLAQGNALGNHERKPVAL